MTREHDSRKAADEKRRKEKPWRRWYATRAWKLKRQIQLAKEPFCQPCRRLGKTRLATIANHVTPHNGDRLLFWHGKLESACKQCHDQAIQQAEKSGFELNIDDDGWPVDARHPFNARSSKATS